MAERKVQNLKNENLLHCEKKLCFHISDVYCKYTTLIGRHKLIERYLRALNQRFLCKQNYKKSLKLMSVILRLWWTSVTLLTRKHIYISLE